VKAPVVVLGGGVAGLATGYYLARAGFPVTVVERNPVVGGLCGTFDVDGFALDHGPHKLYSVVPGVLDEIRRIMDGRLIEHEKRNRIRLLGRFLAYPLQLGNLLPLLGPVRATKLGLGYAAAMAGGILGRREAASYEEYILQRFGRGVYELVFEPLASKVWGDPKLLSADLAQARIPSGGATELILRLLKLKQNTADVDAKHFYYPKGGFGRFPERLCEEIRAAGGEVLTSAAPVALQRDGARVRSVGIEVGGVPRELPCETLVSSIPLHALSGLLAPGDAAVAAEAGRLRLRDLALIFLVVKRDRLLDDHWIFYPEREYPFNRLFEQKAMDETMGPKGRTALCCDLTYEPGDATSKYSDEELVQRCWSTLVRDGLVKPEELERGFVRRFRSFYPMYGVDYRDSLKAVYGRLRGADNLVLTGRLGMFNYNNSDHCLDMGRFVAEGLAGGTRAGDIWTGLEERVQSYRIVD
jgi:protoporphyrinogen oxidase